MMVGWLVAGAVIVGWFVAGAEVGVPVRGPATVDVVVDAVVGGGANDRNGRVKKFERKGNSVGGGGTVEEVEVEVVPVGMLVAVGTEEGREVDVEVAVGAPAEVVVEDGARVVVEEAVVEVTPGTVVALGTVVEVAGCVDGVEVEELDGEVDGGEVEVEVEVLELDVEVDVEVEVDVGVVTGTDEDVVEVEVVVVDIAVPVTTTCSFRLAQELSEAGLLLMSPL
jgi:hypothetical protein